MMACLKGHVEIVKLLLDVQYGTYLNSQGRQVSRSEITAVGFRDLKGQTARDLAKNKGHKEIAQLLLAAEKIRYDKAVSLRGVRVAADSDMRDPSVVLLASGLSEASKGEHLPSESLPPPEEEGSSPWGLLA